MQKWQDWDPRQRTMAGVVAFVVAPAMVIGAGVWSATYAISRAINSTPVQTCQPTDVKGPKPDSFTVNVLNAGGPSGSAGAVAAELPYRHFKPGIAANDTVIKVVKSVGELRYGPAGLDQALVVQKLLLPQAELTPDYRTDNSVDLVLGPDFKGMAPPDGPLVRRDEVKVDVYNPTDKFPDAHEQASKDLAAMGFGVGRVAPRRDDWTSHNALIYYGPRAAVAAQRLKEVVPDAEVLVDPTLKGYNLELWIGAGWSGLVPIAQAKMDPPKTDAGLPTVIRPCPKSS